MNYTLDELSTQVRRDILRMVHKVNSGHPGGSLGCTEFLVALYCKIMNRKENFEIKTILTKSGRQFVTPLSLISLSGGKVFENLFDKKYETAANYNMQGSSVFFDINYSW